MPCRSLGRLRFRVTCDRCGAAIGEGATAQEAARAARANGLACQDGQLLCLAGRRRQSA